LSRLRSVNCFIKEMMMMMMISGFVLLNSTLRQHDLDLNDIQCHGS